MSEIIGERGDPRDRITNQLPLPPHQGPWALPSPTGERGWAFNGERLEITLGIPGNDQEGSFMNATLQDTGNDPNLEFSIAVHVEIPAEIKDEESLAEYLGGIFQHVVALHPMLHVEMQIGPAGDGDDL